MKSIVLLFFITGTVYGTDYAMLGNTVVPGTCTWTTVAGAAVNAWQREDGKSYVCKTTGTPALPGGLSSSSNGMCQYWCDLTKERIELYGITVYSSGQYTPKLLSNPFVKVVPSACVRVDFKCDESLNADTPLNSLSIALYGHADLKKAVLEQKPCNGSLPCATGELLNALKHNAVPSEEAVIAVRGTAVDCLLTYLGIGEVKYNSPCWDQLGENCFVSLNTTKYCFNTEKKIKGITNFGTNSGPSEMWCYYANWAQYRDLPYKTSPTAPDINLDKCDGVIYAFGTIKQVGVNVQTTEYPENSYICTEFEWNDNVQMPAVIKKNKRVLLSIGGWTLGTKPWSNMAKTAGGRKIFVKSCIALMKKYKFSGLDIDWEAPNVRDGIPADIENYGLLAKEFREKLDEEIEPYIFTTAVMVGYPTNTYFTMEKNHVYFDHVFLMAYDLHGGWDPEKRLCHTAWDIGTGCGLKGKECKNPTDYFYLKYAIDYYVRRIPLHKIGVGLGFYGRGWEKVNGAWKASGKDLSPQLKEVGVMGYAEMVNKYKFSCTVDPKQLCCLTSTTINGRELYYGWDNYDSMKAKIDEIFKVFGIKTFFSWAYDYDTLPGAGTHMKIIEHVHKLNGGSAARNINPTYQIGEGPLVRCGGIQAVVGSLVFTKEKYAEFYKLHGFTGVYVANVATLKSCTAGNPQSGKIKIVTKPPTVGIDLNTYLPSTHVDKFLVGLTGNEIVQYSPKVQLSCADINTDNFTRLNYVEIDEDFYFTTPQIRDDMLLIPKGVNYFMSDYKFAVDYINFDTLCMNYKIESLPSCIAVTCSGDPNCINKYASVCGQAAAIIQDARRSNKLVVNAFTELQNEHLRATLYDFTGTGTGQGDNRFIVGAVALGVAVAATAVAGAALGVAVAASNKINAVQAQLDATKDTLIKLGNEFVTISNKLDKNIRSVDQRVSDLQEGINKRFDIVNKNFDAIHDNQKIIINDVNDKFRVVVNYQSWYQQMVSLTDQLTQGAIQMNHKTTMTKLCFLSLAKGTMENCPSGLKEFVEHPGLMTTETVSALRYYKKKLIIVNRVPSKMTPFTPSVAFPLPIMKHGEVCWPDYKLTYIEGKTFSPLECSSKYCQDPELDFGWERCRENYTHCKFVCSTCYRGVCYDPDTNTVSYNKSGGFDVKFEINPRPEFNPLPGLINISAILPYLNLTAPTTIDHLNTSSNLVSIQDNIQNIKDILAKYETLYNALGAFGGDPQTVLYIIGALLAVCIVYISISLVFNVLKLLKFSKTKSKGYSTLPGDGW